MGRYGRPLLVSTLALWCMAVPTHAQGVFCWTLSPFVDELTVTVTQPDPAIGEYQLAGTWQGEDAYSLALGGSADIVEGRALLNFVMYNPSTFFSGNPQGVLHASLHLTQAMGPYTFTFTGGSPPFQASGIMVHHPCGQAPDESLRGQAPVVMRGTSAPPLAGEAPQE